MTEPNPLHGAIDETQPHSATEGGVSEKLREALADICENAESAGPQTNYCMVPAALISIARAALAAEEDGGWLLERGDPSAPEYIYASQSGLEWTRDHAQALRLSRREDADALAWIIEDCTRVAEHFWTPSPKDEP